ncbi:alpha-1-antichymotrypsin-like [Myotis yumanensis]|uniref:alpha-1-antichymotrypsin-like n=1 Tax=Myotis yumanensis TaxID=159337 RepID=UPI0038D1DFDF
MSVLLALGLLAAGLGPTAHGLPGDTPDQKVTRGNETPVDSLRLASSNADFAFSLYRQLARKNPDKNVLFSPTGVSTALAFLSLGARGRTLTEIHRGLKVNLTETSGTEIHQGFQRLLRALGRPRGQLRLSVGNAMFVSEQLKVLDEFRADAEALYASQALSTDFRDAPAAQRLINDYVREKTQGKLVDLVGDLDAGTAMVLVNYIFFKAKWKTPFDPNDTFQSKFYVGQGRWVTVPMMSSEDLKTPYFRDEALACWVVELGYAGAASALFVLPDKGKMKAVEAALRPETLRRWRDSLRMRPMELHLPKFSLSSLYHLEGVLPRLGMRKVFSKKADLSGITGDKNLAVSQVVHKSLMDVAETGTEAAAATGVRVMLKSARIPRASVKFNRPFLFAILSEDTQSILFCGKVANPSAA